MDENHVLTIDEIRDMRPGDTAYVENQIDRSFPSGPHIMTEDGLEDDKGFFYPMEELEPDYGIADIHGNGIRVWKREPTEQDLQADPWRLKNGTVWVRPEGSE